MASNGIVQLSVPQFYGINQAQERVAMGYATRAENIDTRYGKLQSAAGFSAYTPDLGEAIITLARFHRRFYSPASERDVLVAATATKIYVLVEGAQSPEWKLVYSTATSGSWDYVAYEDYRDNAETPVDILLMTNAQDGMISIWGDNLTASIVETPAKFGALTRYKERIFGTAATGEPDRIWYSAPFNPRDWEQNATIPEDGGGFLDYPTWDGDSFIALRPFGSYLLAFKQRMICIVSGADPGEFTIREGYGTDGPLSENTVVINETAAFFLATSGIGLFDGNTIKMLSRDIISAIASRININAISTASAAIHDGVYCCAVPLDQSTVPNAIIEYDTERGTFMLRTGFTVGSLCSSGNGALLLTTVKSPDRVCLWGQGEDYDGEPVHAIWESPWTDMDAKETTKSGFRIRCLAEGSGPIDFSIQTERKTKTKTIPIPTPETVKKKPVQKNISNRGRQFRFKIESSTRFSIPTGLQIETELDSD